MTAYTYPELDRLLAEASAQLAASIEAACAVAIALQHPDYRDRLYMIEAPTTELSIDRGFDLLENAMRVWVERKVAFASRVDP